jgi:hypothetical protein
MSHTTIYTFGPDGKAEYNSQIKCAPAGAFFIARTMMKVHGCEPEGIFPGYEAERCAMRQLYSRSWPESDYPMSRGDALLLQSTAHRMLIRREIIADVAAEWRRFYREHVEGTATWRTTLDIADQLELILEFEDDVQAVAFHHSSCDGDDEWEVDQICECCGQRIEDADPLPYDINVHEGHIDLVEVMAEWDRHHRDQA